MLASFARGSDIALNTSGRSYPELQGLHRFQRWLTESGRVTDGEGSVWWSKVNGLMLLDMVESAALGRQDAVGCSGPVRAWAAYWTNHTKGERTRLFWEAHQCGLNEAGRKAESVLALEPPVERDFITTALSSVEIAALANLPTGRGGSRVVGGFCRVFYPSSYPADDEAGADARSLLARATGGSHPRMRIVAAVIRGRFGR
ncbi:MAG: hypothetical protein HYR89_09330 [Actinobacteria bacterium]|nr:hypothetical protein [Actinomycetota bacterium]